MKKPSAIPFFLLLAPILASCGLKDTQNIQATLKGNRGVSKVFTTELHPSFKLNACVGCHGATQAPLFAVSNVTEAQTTTSLSRGLIDFQNPARSRLVQKMHERHQCGSGCEQIAAFFEDAIAKWAKEREDEGAPEIPDSLTAFHVATSAKPFANTASSTIDTITRWNISSEVPSLRRTQMEVVWRVKSAPAAGSLGSFEIRGIRVGSQDDILRVRKIKILQNGSPTASLNFSFADQSIANLVIPNTGNLPFPLLGIPGALNLPITETVSFQNATDNIAVYFDILAPTNSLPSDVPVVPPTGPLTEPQRYQLAHDVLRLRCLGCHSNQSSYRLSGVADTDKPPTVARINRTAGQQANSLLLQKGAGQVGHGGGGVLAVNGAEYNIILTWIQTAP